MSESDGGRAMLIFARVMDQLQRILCRFEGQRRGPLFICLGGMHGNEPAGVRAIQTVATLLEVEPSLNPTFMFSGRMLGIAGNLKALSLGKRFLRHDMNRILTPGYIKDILTSDPDTLEDEASEVFAVVSAISDEIEEYDPDRIVILDIHTTSASGGIFVIAADDPESVRIGTSLHAPVILDFAREVQGTTLGYFTEENLHRDVVTVVFESGQHQEPLSVNRAIAAIINCMRTIGCVSPDAVENKHDRILLEYATGLPKVARLVERHHIPDGTHFAMSRAWHNFETVSSGEVVAFQDGRPVLAKNDGLILLPRLQELGNDGFFIVRPELMC